ncbi:MAG: hypothetical protein M1818_002276 [Claussenomyces sp. TS43310]|nr:MAG: hypothetical protein M1818_002276 [Claussenomyces sp. TS43310]
MAHGVNFTQWQSFKEVVERLNAGADVFTTYKLLFMGRHGDGYHNAEEAYVGTPAWNCYYSLLDGNGTVTWADAHLTPLGISQAQIVNAFWAHELEDQRAPFPQSYYVSPLTRCLQTANITFTGLDLPFAHPFIPTIKELLRESISGHTCDRRSNATNIHASFPWYEFETGFTETDILWEQGRGETDTDQDIRSRKVLDDIFVNDDNTWISITSHSGEIASILRVLGHRAFSLGTGAVIPVFVKAVVLPAPAPRTAVAPYTTISTCASPPAATATS